jgi:hypothetical protein
MIDIIFRFLQKQSMKINLVPSLQANKIRTPSKTKSSVIGPPKSAGLYEFVTPTNIITI